MLSVNSYPKVYVDDCRSRIAVQAADYRALAKATAPHPTVATALRSFEPHFFNSMVLALEGHFVHRARAPEMKDGNPLNEVRMLSNSLMSHGGILGADKAIKYNPEKSVLKIRIGDRIAVNDTDFTRLASAFLAEIAAKYP